MLISDSTTEYNALRPDVHVHLSGGHFQRAVASFEIKSPWASSKETQKDLARVILSCISYHKQDEKHYDTEDEIPANLGVHLAGREGRVYEVFLYKALYLAVEIGDLTVPTVLTRGKIKAIASSVNQWNTLMNRITRTKKNMLRHAIRPRSVSLLPPTPDKKTTKPT
ncbi:hypothetical protein BC832DRAFT_402671 [Gaertneriomyces semiglobifer]|nr:hypothetical protein BC832DRAFT_402671 [Gaertneriomyces semiglobifer]